MNNYADPSLVSLAPEVRSTITSFVSGAPGIESGVVANGDSDQLLRPKDLNALSRTCKALRDTSLPWLYRRVDVRIGQSEDFQLDALENLIAGSGEGLKSTRQLRILPQQGPLHPFKIVDSDENTEHARDFHHDCHHDYHPGSRVSSLFNILVRQLIMKIPINCLHRFEYVLFSIPRPFGILQSCNLVPNQ